MNANDVLRRVRYTFDFNDSKMMGLFALGSLEVTRAQVSNWLKREDHEDFQPCSDTELAMFLNGLITDKRGKKEGAEPDPEKRLTNNAILMKLKIALNLKAEDVLAVVALSGQKLSKHELSAFFRKPAHKHFRECKDQVLRGFLKGLQLTYREEDVEAELDEPLEEQTPQPDESDQPAKHTFQWKKP
jgi:uncharacterized protein YehS (DUF1456 family)